MPSPVIQAEPAISSPSTRAKPTQAARPLFTLRQINLFCWALFGAILALPLAIEVKSQIQEGRSLKAERDFVFFYSMGRMLNQHPPSQLYDFELQQKVETEVLPLKKGRQYTPNPYSPFIALLFRPFALLPFSTAYPLWLLFTFSLYVVGLSMAASSRFPNDALRRSLIFCGAFSFLPLLVDYDGWTNSDHRLHRYCSGVSRRESGTPAA